jgi:hypothetical protein
MPWEFLEGKYALCREQFLAFHLKLEKNTVLAAQAGSKINI